MAEHLHRVELTDSFLARLDAIEGFLTALAGLRATVVPNLARFPLMGRRYLDQPPQSVEALDQLAKLPPGAADRLRVLLHGDYVMLYSVVGEVVYLLSIRHHRQLSFDFAGLWPT